MTNKIFLDCGSNIGQGYEYFRDLYGEEYQYILFEPNPNCYDILIKKYKDHNITIHNKAVSNKVEELVFYYTEDTSEGGSIIEEHNSNYYHSKDVNKVTVQTINLIDFIDQIYTKDSEIVLKLDVESSEYDILESMIKDETIFKLKKIYCEFHSQYMAEDTKQIFSQKEKKILRFIKQNNIDFEIWH
jgi:FkbM family methyltransferase